MDLLVSKHVVVLAVYPLLVLELLVHVLDAQHLVNCHAEIHVELSAHFSALVHVALHVQVLVELSAVVVLKLVWITALLIALVHALRSVKDHALIHVKVVALAAVAQDANQHAVWAALTIALWDADKTALPHVVLHAQEVVHRIAMLAAQLNAFNYALDARQRVLAVAQVVVIHVLETAMDARVIAHQYVKADAAQDAPVDAEIIACLAA